MKLILTYLFIGVMLTCCTERKVIKDERDHLLSLEKQWLEKEFVLDTAFISSLIDSTFIDVTETGLKNKKEDLLAMYTNIDQRIKKGILIDSFKLENEKVNMYSNSAVVTFVVHTYRHNGDSLFERRTRFYDVWVKRGNQWKAVASQGTPLPGAVTMTQN
jgi:hypothetical protein